jgi:general secretion pathway protein L
MKMVGGKVTKAISNLQKWFCDEIAAVMPRSIGPMFFGSPAARKLSFHGDASIVVEQGGNLVAPRSLIGPSPPDLQPVSSCVVDAALPASFFLLRQIDLPAAAARTLHSAAELDMVRRTPFRTTDVCWAISPPNRHAGRVRVQQWIAKRSDIEELRVRLDKIALTLRQISVDGHLEAGAVASLSGPFAARSRRWRLVNGVTAAVSIMLAVAIGLLPAWSAREYLIATDRELATLRDQALALRREVDALRSKESERSAFVDAVVRRPRLIEVLRELTVALPDEIWLVEVNYRPGVVAVTGEIDGSAADLVLSLADASAFTNPRLNGPVALTAQGGERFELAIDTGSSP